MKIRSSTMLMLTLSMTVHAGFWGSVGDWFEHVGHTIEHTAVDVGHAIEHEVVDDWHAVTHTFTEIEQGLEDEFNALGHGIKEAWNEAGDEISDKWHALTKWCEDRWDEVKHAFYEPFPILTKEYPFRGTEEYPTNTTLTYKMFVPSSYNPSKPCKMIVALHGLWSNPDQMMHYPLFTSLAHIYDYIIVCPQGYNESSWYGAQAVVSDEDMIAAAKLAGIQPDGDHGYKAWIDRKVGAWGEQDVWNVIDEVKRDYNIDVDRTFLMGHSMGGGGTYYLASKRPEMFAGIGTLAPATYADPNLAEKFRHVPVICCQGLYDEPRQDCDSSGIFEQVFEHPTPGVDPAVTQKWIDRMRELDMDVTYKTNPIANHITVIPMLYNLVLFFNGKSRTPLNKRHQYGPAVMEPKTDNSTVYAIRSVSSGLFLDGRAAGYTEPKLTDRNPHGDTYLNWKLRSVEGNVALVSVSSGMSLDGRGGQQNPYLNPADPADNSYLQFNLVPVGDDGRFALKGVHSGLYLDGRNSACVDPYMKAASDPSSDGFLHWEFIKC